jgi:hypothetical protein
MVRFLTRSARTRINTLINSNIQAEIITKPVGNLYDTNLWQCRYGFYPDHGRANNRAAPT